MHDIISSMGSIMATRSNYLCLTGWHTRAGIRQLVNVIHDTVFGHSLRYNDNDSEFATSHNAEGFSLSAVEDCAVVTISHPLIFVVVFWNNPIICSLT